MRLMGVLLYEVGGVEVEDVHSSWGLKYHTTGVGTYLS